MRGFLRHTGGEPSLAFADAAERASGRPPLVLLHGVTRSHGDFSPIAARLAASWRLVAVDHRGHGDSQRADRYLVVDYVADAVRFLRDEIRSPVVLLGHSLGAMAAAGAAAAIPHLVEGVVLIDPPFHSMGERIHGTAWQAQFRGMREAALRGGCVDDLAAALAAIRLPMPDGGTVRLGALREPAAIRWSAECLARLDPAVLTPVIEGRWFDGYDPPAIAARIECPVRLLQADPGAGGALGDDDCRGFAARVADCRIERFPGTGHLLHWQQPARVCAAVDALAPLGEPAAPAACGRPPVGGES
jgi:pimeloyl-ACP methyl ester carboxylesterase